MKISDGLLPEFDQEMKSTRKTLERVPEEKLAWKPHEKSMSLGRLAGHIAELVGFGPMVLSTDSIDLGSGQYKPLIPTTRQQVLEAFDKNVTAARAAIAGTSDEQYMQPWSLLFSGKTIFAA